jgi:hypothetical protein
MLTENQKLARLTAREYIASLQEIKQLIGISSKLAEIHVQRPSLFNEWSAAGKP